MMGTRSHNTVQRTKINWDHVFDADPAPKTELTPQQEIEVLNAAIADEAETIRAYASSPRVVAVSQAQIVLYETEIQNWKKEIYAAEQEAFDRLMRATAVYPMFLAKRAWFIKLIEERKAVQR